MAQTLERTPEELEQHILGQAEQAVLAMQEAGRSIRRSLLALVQTLPVLPQYQINDTTRRLEQVFPPNSTPSPAGIVIENRGLLSPDAIILDKEGMYRLPIRGDEYGYIGFSVGDRHEVEVSEYVRLSRRAVERFHYYARQCQEQGIRVYGY